MLSIKSPNPKNFRKFGKIIEYPDKSLKGRKRNLWRIVHSQPEKTGWRVAYLVLRDKTIGRLERHPDSDETFEPVKGTALMFISKTMDLQAVEYFYLDKPVIIKKGVWHGLISIDKETEIKIVENNEVKCEYWQLGFRAAKPEDLLH